MAVSMRERPVVKGKDAERFMENVRRNNEYMRQRRQERNLNQYNNEDNRTIKS